MVLENYIRSLSDPVLGGFRLAAEQEKSNSPELSQVFECDDYDEHDNDPATTRRQRNETTKQQSERSFECTSERESGRVRVDGRRAESHAGRRAESHAGRPV